MRAGLSVVRTKHGVRVMEGGLVLSEVRRTPGPTHTLFDILAAAISTQTPGPSLGILGFAAGGIVAPLRALGFGHPIEAVDLDVSLLPLFRRLSVPWCSRVVVAEANAVDWLERRSKPLDLVLEDLSATVEGQLAKPPVCFDTLPQLVRTRLAPHGVLVVNVLPTPGYTMPEALSLLAAPYRRAVALVLRDWENHILVAGDQIEGAREIGRAMRHALQAIGSREAGGFRVRSLRP